MVLVSRSLDGRRGRAQAVTSSVPAGCLKRDSNPFAFVSRAPRGLLGTPFG